MGWRSAIKYSQHSCYLSRHKAMSDNASRSAPAYEATAPENYFWFGTARLWTLLPMTGTGPGLRGYTPNDSTFRQKLPFWRRGYDWHSEPIAKLTVTGGRLDGPSAPLIADHANNVTTQPASMMTGVDLPALGCWEITGHYGDDDLTFVVWISKWALPLIDPDLLQRVAISPATTLLVTVSR
jgi:hypothetical protein